MSSISSLSILAISGSLKSTSSNSRILKAISEFAPAGIEFIIYNELEELPPFNPDKESGNEAVKRFRDLLGKSDGVIISTPEYAFGVPGSLKNALDWTVSSGEFNEKPVIAISASPMYEGGLKAMNSLMLTLSALGTIMTEKSSLSIPNISKKIDDQGVVRDEKTLSELKLLFENLLENIKRKKRKSLL